MEKLDTFADGRIFTGVKAKELNLVDELGDFLQAVKTAARRAKRLGLNAGQIQSFAIRVADYLRSSFPRDPKLQHDDAVSFDRDRFGLFLAFRRKGDSERKLRLQ